ncbi:MAG: YkvA family protein [Microcella sp.]|uniref:YkvA family protein n=1 Tax=Microcella sp. TaxID=1913979 RepID=UPI0033154C52
MSRGRAILSAVLVALGAIAYGVSPVDVIPELLVGPLGFGDDLAVLAGAGFAIWKLLSGRNPRRSAAGAGPQPGAQPDPHYEQKPRPPE